MLELTTLGFFVNHMVIFICNISLYEEDAIPLPNT